MGAAEFWDDCVCDLATLFGEREIDTGDGRRSDWPGNVGSHLGARADTTCPGRERSRVRKGQVDPQRMASKSVQFIRALLFMERVSASARLFTRISVCLQLQSYSYSYNLAIAFTNLVIG
jgi:hypothetical protein